MTQLPAEVRDWLIATGQGDRVRLELLGGGSINQSFLMRTASGASYFLKTHPNPPQDFYLREAEGLQALDLPGTPAVPGVILVGSDFLLLEDLHSAPRREDFWLRYGRQLACLHRHTNPKFGFDHDNFIGATPQLNSWMDSGLSFFRQKRLAPQIAWAAERGSLSRSDLADCDSLLARLPDLLPDGPACLLHGDLWSGNLATDATGNPALIDPAVYYGWAEADLAMAELFGSYPDSFYDAYLELNPLPAGFRERFPLYNLYHLLNHLNLFGSSYLSGVQAVLHQYR